MVVMFVDCCVGCYGTFGTIPTVGILRGGSFWLRQNPYKPVNILSDHPLFNGLHWWVVTLPMFVRCQCLITRKVAELFGFNCGVKPFYAACRIDKLSRGSIWCLSNASFETAVSQCHNSYFWAKINDHGIWQGNMGWILAQWQHPVVSCVATDRSIGQCTPHHTGASPWPSKWSANVVHCFAIVDLLLYIIVARWLCYGWLKKNKPF